jgi:hypothetical protein
MTMFVDGEPLDVDKLNKLNEMITSLDARMSQFITKYDAQNKKVVNKIPIIHIGEPVPVSLKPGQVVQRIPVNSSDLDKSDSIPRYFVTISNAGKAKVSFSIKEVTRTSFTVQIDSDKDVTASIQWIAVAEKTIS